MNIVDYVIIGIIGISVLFGLYRGFIASVLNMGCGLMSFLASFWVSPKLAAAVQSNQSFLNMLLHYTDASSRIGDLETAITNVATLTSQSINSILEKVNLPAPLDTLLRVNLENNVYASSGLSTVSDYVSQTILQASINIICFLVSFLVLYIVLAIVLNLLKDFGLTDFYLELSTKDPNKYVGSDEIWEEATNTLAEVAKESNLELVDDPCGAAFYGPKISVQARDAIGRTWQVSTIQLDFNLPERFQLEYIAKDGTHQRPVMIHRALFGSIERFFAVLLEHYAGAFPAWLAPVQVLGVPVADEFAPHLAGFVKSLEDEMVRCEIDYSDDRFGKKIRNASKSKVPFILIVGEEDMNNNAVSFRFRDGSQLNGVPVDTAREQILTVIKKRVQVNSADDFNAAVAE